MDRVTRLSFQRLGTRLALKTSINLPLGLIMAILSRQALWLHYPNSDPGLLHHYNAALVCMSLGTVVLFATVLEVLLVKFGIRCYKRIVKTVSKLSLVFACLIAITGVSTMIIAHACQDLAREVGVRQCMQRTDVPLIDNAAIIRLKKECQASTWDFLTICGCFTFVVAIKFWIDKWICLSVVDEIRQLEDRDSPRYYDAVVYFGNVDDTDQ